MRKSGCNSRGRCRVSFSEQPPSQQWTGLNYRGEEFAEVWFKPEGEPLALAFRIPRASFQIPGIDRLLTPKNLLMAVGIREDEVESWSTEGSSHEGMNESNSELAVPLLPPPQNATHLNVYFSLKPTSEVLEVSEAKWQDLESRWDAILGLEASIDTLRISMESLRGNGSFVAEDVDGGRKAECPECGCGSMEQSKKPSTFCPAEDERVYPSFHLGDGHARTEEARGGFQIPRSASDSYFSDKRGWGPARKRAKGPADIIRAGCDDLSRMQKYLRGGSGSLEDTA